MKTSINFKQYLGWVLLVSTVIFPWNLIAEPIEKDENRVKRLLNEMDDLWRGESSYAVTTMQVKTEHYIRTLHG